MYKNLKIPAVECLGNGNYHVCRKLFPPKQHFFKWIPAPENCKNQEIIRIKSRKINRTLKLCTLALNVNMSIIINKHFAKLIGAAS